jgi:hypothetical protein
MERIELVRRSLRCFTFGVLGLSPLLGLPVAGLAMGEFVRATRRAGAQWNPASKWLHWGLALACVSVTLPPAILQLLVAAPITEALLTELWT